MDTVQPDVEFRVMPSGDGRWYWEVITQRNSVIKRGELSPKVGDGGDQAAA